MWKKFSLVGMLFRISIKCMPFTLKCTSYYSTVSVGSWSNIINNPTCPFNTEFHSYVQKYNISDEINVHVRDDLHHLLHVRVRAELEESDKLLKFFFITISMYYS